MDRDEDVSELELKIARYERAGGVADTETCVIKKGPRAYKTVTLSSFINSETGEVKKRVLQARTWPRHWDRPGFDWSRPDHSWRCENEEIDKVRAFLNDSLPEEGKYRLIRADSSFADLLNQIQAGGVEVGLLAKLVESAQGIPEFIEALAVTDHGRLLAEAVEMRRRRASLMALRQIIEDPASTEGDIHKRLTGHPWIFGGQYVGEALRRELTTGDILDIPLLRGDGSLQVVELKRANIPKLIVKHRSHLIPGPEVHEAVCQAQNYLRSLDEERAQILAKHKIECRRAFATVVIGHERFASAIDAQEIAETLRTYNGHLSRVEVITFGQLLASADRALNFSPPAEHTKEADPDPLQWDDPWAATDDDPPF